MKKAIIVGNTGQDGTYLSDLLLSKNYELLGISSHSVSGNSHGFASLDVLNTGEVGQLTVKVQPDEIYFLAAVHQSSSDQPIEDGALFQNSLDLNVKAVVNFLEGIRKYAPKAKLFYAASSHVFGNPGISPQDERTPLQPDCIYGITKEAGLRACRFYRENHGVFASVGIFYNHESPIRASKYVSRKIVENAVAIKKKLRSELVLGNLDSQIDWGYAPDYVRAVYGMMQLKQSDDFLISSGSVHTIRDFVEGVFACLDLDWTQFVKINPALITKKQKQNLFGNSTKIRKATGWGPSVDFKGLIKLLVEAELAKHDKK